VSELVTTRIRATAAKPGLPHLPEALAGHAERADAAQMGYLDFLDLVLEEELAVREERRLHHALRASKMPHHKTLELSGVDLEIFHVFAGSDVAEMPVA
jgi:DNA replication protein DnaC